MKNKGISVLLILFVLAATTVPAAVGSPAQDESLPNINFKTVQLSNYTINATNVTLTLVFNNSLLDINLGATGKIRVGFSGTSAFNVSDVTNISLTINGVPIDIVGMGTFEEEMEQYIDVYIQEPIETTDNVTIVVEGLKNPTEPGTYTVAVSTWIAGSMRSSGATTVTIKGPKPPITLPKPFLIGEHESEHCPDCSPDTSYDILDEDKTLVGYNEDGPVYEISYPLSYELECDEEQFYYNVYAWNLSYQNLTFKGMKIFVDNEFMMWLPAANFTTYNECVLISDGDVSYGIITEDFTPKNSEVEGWTLEGFEHAEPSDMVVYFNRGYGWALTTNPTGYEIENNSYIMTAEMNLTDGESADVKDYDGPVYVDFDYALALDENVTVTLQYMYFNTSDDNWTDWIDIVTFTSADETPWDSYSGSISVENATKIKFRFFVNYTTVNEFTKPGFALFSFKVSNKVQSDCDTVYAVNPLDGMNTTLLVYDLSTLLYEYVEENGSITIELEAVYQLEDEEMLEKYDPIQVAAQDFIIERPPCLELTLCDVLSEARYIVVGGGSWALGSPQPYFGWDFDANNEPVIVTGHGSLAADNLGVLFFLSQVGADPNKVIFDDNPQYVDLASGEIRGLQEEDIIILLGSSWVNLPLGYYEYVTGDAPVVRVSPQAFVLPNGTVVEWAGPDEQWYDVSRDIFVIQWFTTEDGVMVFSVEGAGVDGTVAGSWLVSWLVAVGEGTYLPPSGYIVGEWHESYVSDEYVSDLPIFAPAWIRGAPEDVNGFSTGDDVVKILYMDAGDLEDVVEDLVDELDGDYDAWGRPVFITEPLPSCYCELSPRG